MTNLEFAYWPSERDASPMPSRRGVVRHGLRQVDGHIDGNRIDKVLVQRDA